MLILSRKLGERVTIGTNITVEIAAITSGNRVKLAISAPSDTPIFRNEVLAKLALTAGEAAARGKAEPRYEEIELEEQELAKAV